MTGKKCANFVHNLKTWKSPIIIGAGEMVSRGHIWPPALCLTLQPVGYSISARTLPLPVFLNGYTKKLTKSGQSFSPLIYTHRERYRWRQAMQSAQSLPLAPQSSLQTTDWGGGGHRLKIWCFWRLLYLMKIIQYFNTCKLKKLVLSAPYWGERQGTHWLRKIVLHIHSLKY